MVSDLCNNEHRQLYSDILILKAIVQVSNIQKWNETT
jgi:hypothetical protein